MRFHKKNWECKSPTKNSLKLEHERIEACQNTVQCLYLTGFMGFIDSIEYFTGLGYFLNSVWWILSVNDFCEWAFKTHAAVWRFFFIHFCCNVYSALRLTNFEPQYLYLTTFMGFIDSMEYSVWWTLSFNVFCERAFKTHTAIHSCEAYSSVNRLWNTIFW